MSDHPCVARVYAEHQISDISVTGTFIDSLAQASDILECRWRGGIDMGTKDDYFTVLICLC